jgi:hypothetical protein
MGYGLDDWIYWDLLLQSHLITIMALSLIYPLHKSLGHAPFSFSSVELRCVPLIIPRHGPHGKHVSRLKNACLLVCCVWISYCWEPNFGNMFTEPLASSGHMLHYIKQDRLSYLFPTFSGSGCYRMWYRKVGVLEDIARKSLYLQKLRICIACVAREKHNEALEATGHDSWDKDLSRGKMFDVCARKEYITP